MIILFKSKIFSMSTSLILFLLLVQVANAGKIKIEVRKYSIIQSKFLSSEELSNAGKIKISSYERKMSAKLRKLIREFRKRSFENKDVAVRYFQSQAEKYQKLGEFHEALLISKVITSLDPTNIRANEIKLICFKTLKSFNEGFAEYEFYMKKYPQNIDFRSYYETLKKANAEDKILKLGRKRVLKEASNKYKKNEVEGIEAYYKIINIFHKKLRYNDEIKSIIDFRNHLIGSGNLEEAIKISKRYIQLTKEAVSAKEWGKIEKQYIKVYKNIFDFYSKLDDYKGFLSWNDDFKVIKNRRFVTLHNDLITFLYGKALMRSRKYSDAQNIFLNLYLNQPTSDYSREAKKYFEGCKRAIKGIVDVSINSIPTKAEVYIDGLKRGKTPLMIEVPDKDFVLKIVKNSYQTYEKKIVVNAAEGNFNFSIELAYCKIVFISGDSSYCPGVVMNFVDIGTVKWHQDCFGLYKLEIINTEKIEKNSKNTIRLQPGKYHIKASSFGEMYIKSDKFIEKDIIIPPSKTLEVKVKGAYIGDNKYPYKLFFRLK